MELRQWIGGRIIENLDNRGWDNKGSTEFALKLESIVQRTSSDAW